MKLSKPFYGHFSLTMGIKTFHTVRDPTNELKILNINSNFLIVEQDLICRTMFAHFEIKYIY